jgi:hypothetical protein
MSSWNVVRKQQNFQRIIVKEFGACTLPLQIEMMVGPELVLPSSS